MGVPQEDGVTRDQKTESADQLPDKKIEPATETATADVPAAPVEAQPATETAPPANA